MQQLRFPKEPVAWQNYVNHLLAELRVDYSRLWQVLPQLPDPEAGIPYTGPLVPAAFCWPYQACARETHDPCGLACLQLTVALARPEASGTAGCQDCHLLDGTFELNITSGASGATQCVWWANCINFVNCGSVSFNYQLVYTRATGKYALTLVGYSALNCTGGASAQAQWSYNGAKNGANEAFPITLNTVGGSGTQVAIPAGLGGAKACHLSSNVTIDLCP